VRLVFGAIIWPDGLRTGPNPKLTACDTTTCRGPTARGTKLGDFGTWLEAQSRSVLPKSPLGEAIYYALHNWQALNVYLEDGDLDIDNNAAERALKCVAIGRKNWLFAGSDRGGKTAATLYSLVVSAKHHGLDPFAYLRDVIDRYSAHPASRIGEFLPDKWKQLREPKPAEEPALAATSK
jgi:transposase